MPFKHDELVQIGHAFDKGPFQVVGETLTFESGFAPTEAQCQAALLVKMKEEATDSIDAEYEARRQKYLTAGPTMSMIYNLKAEEAKEFQTNPAGNYPFLKSSVDSGEAESLEAAAILVLGKQAELKTLAAVLETQRLAKKIAIKEAKTVTELEALLA